MLKNGKKAVQGEQVSEKQLSGNVEALIKNGSIVKVDAKKLQEKKLQKK